MPANKGSSPVKGNPEGKTRWYMPPVRESNSDVVAVVCSDIHLSLNPPLIRTAEPDWLVAQARQLDELDLLAKVHSCPIIIAGDLFDKACPPVEFINWTIKHLPKCYAIVGQHDLMHHSYEDIKKTAYWTLVEAGVIINLEPDSPIEYWAKRWPIRMWGFPWGHKVKPCPDSADMILEIAIVHSFIWTAHTGYEGAPEEQRLKHLWKKMIGFDCVVSGDNHQHFSIKHKTRNQMIYNCGAFFRRKSTERSSSPSVGLIHADGTTERKLLDVSKDKFIDLTSEGELTSEEMEEFREEIKKNVDSAIDFGENLNKTIAREKVTEEVRSIILKALEEKC